MYKISGYLTEAKLYDVLVAWVGEENVKKQIQVPGTRMRSDFEVYKYGGYWAVEFDGDAHYRDPNVIHRDKVKDDISASLGKMVVRVPYFVQLDTETFAHLFHLDRFPEEPIFEIETDFPHGFHTTKFLPSSFCPLGYGRLLHEYERLPLRVQRDIDESLAAKCLELGERLTYYRFGIVVEDKDGNDETVSFQEFVRRSRMIHGDKYEYRRPL